MTNTADLSTETNQQPVETIPQHARGTLQCAEWQIQTLLTKKQGLTTEEEDCIDDGFYLCDISIVERKLQAWKRLFPRVRPFYALKCNPDAVVASVLPAFDCASVAELTLASMNALNCARDIVYANPQRAEQDLEQALRMFPNDPPAYTFDGPEELHKIRWAQEQFQKESRYPPPPLILRLLVPDHDSQVPLGEKFGAPMDRIPVLLETAQELGLSVVGVSFHCGSGNHDPTAYTTALKLAKEALTMIQARFDLPKTGSWVVDMGGGYPGRDGAGADTARFGGSIPDTDMATQEETTSRIADAVCPLLDELFPMGEQIQLIAEPGRYFVEAAFVLCSRIYRVKEDNDGARHYYIAQGVQGVFKDCVLCGETFVPIPLFADQHSTNVMPSYVHGPSGEDFDTICKEFPLPKLGVGDWLLFDRMGAYTLSIAARSGRPPIRYVRS